MGGAKGVEKRERVLLFKKFLNLNFHTAGSLGEEKPEDGFNL